MSRILTSKERKKELNRALKPWKMMACMLITGLISSVMMNPVWLPFSMLAGFIVSFIYYVIMKGE